MSTADGGGKYLEAGHLCSLTKQLPKSARLQVNMVGNLAVFNPDGVYIGYIDFLTGELNLEEQ